MDMVGLKKRNRQLSENIENALQSLSLFYQDGVIDRRKIYDAIDHLNRSVSSETIGAVVDNKGTGENIRAERIEKALNEDKMLAGKIVAKIITELMDRSGFDDLWGNLDEDTCTEITGMLEKIASTIIEEDRREFRGECAKMADELKL